MKNRQRKDYMTTANLVRIGESPSAAERSLLCNIIYGEDEKCVERQHRARHAMKKEKVTTLHAAAGEHNNRAN